MRFDNGEYFIKVGTDSPENLLAYYEFDGTKDNGNMGVSGNADKLHHYDAHLKDYQSGDPTWKGGKGKRIIGALNYLAAKGVNSISFLPNNVGGDSNDVWPFASSQEKTRYLSQIYAVPPG